MNVKIRDRFSRIKRVIPVLSGKGGVGKTTVAASISIALASKGHKVGLLDIDLCGPSIPKILGLENAKVHQSSHGWIPVRHPEMPGLSCMSIGFLLDSKTSSVVWRGPKKTAMIKQLVGDVDWGDLDYLVVDTPPGTSDEHITLAEILKLAKETNPDRSDDAVLVTTPQWISLSDVQKEIDFCRQTGQGIRGLVENMGGYICPHCSECSHLFSSQGGQNLAQTENIPFLGSIPFDPQFGKTTESSTTPFPVAFPQSNIFSFFLRLTDTLDENHQASQNGEV